MNTKIFDSLLEPTFIIGENLKVIYCNEPAALLIDQSVRKMIRTAPLLTDLIEFSEPLVALQDLSSVSDATAYQELKFSTSSGKTGKVQVTFQSWDPEARQWLIYLRDVTLEETLQSKYRAELNQKEDVIKDLQTARDELKNYSENLEIMVADRTKEISELNDTMRALLDSLSQGYFLFDSEGQCLPVYSKACAETLESIPAGKPVWELLKIPDSKVDGFQKWLKATVTEMLPFPDMAPLGPQTYPHSKGLTIQMEYFPVRSPSGEIQALVGVATDITALVQAQKEALHERSQSKMILNVVRNRTAAAMLVSESRQMLAELLAEFDKSQPSKEVIFRLLHTLKGGMASFDVQSIAELCHQAENQLADWNPEAERPLEFENLHGICTQIADTFHEFLDQNKVVFGRSLDSKSRWVEMTVEQIQSFAFRNRLSGELLRAYADEFLSEPVQKYLEHYDGVAATLAEQEGKKLLPLSWVGGDLRVTPEPLQTLFGSLVHAYRNAVDHGLEPEADRLAAGKPGSGCIQTRFRREIRDDYPWLIIEIEDDGRGINPARIRQKLSEKGLASMEETDQQVIQHVFDSQFSTRNAVSETSGRGVGMDAILNSALDLGGTARVESRLNLGTVLIIEFPEPGARPVLTPKIAS